MLQTLFNAHDLLFKRIDEPLEVFQNENSSEHAWTCVQCESVNPSVSSYCKACETAKDLLSDNKPFLSEISLSSDILQLAAHSNNVFV